MVYTVLKMLFPGQHMTGTATTGVDGQPQRAGETRQFPTNDMGAQGNLPKWGITEKT